MLEALDKDKFARDKLQSWLYRVAHNVIIDDVRYQQRRPTQALYDSLEANEENDPSVLVGQQMEEEIIWNAIQRLTKDQKDVIILRFGEGLTAPQVAKILNKSEEAVRALQRRGLVNLRKILSQP
jgi:RNA polymerase sigma-70 factor (ECF subfamily)